MNRHNCAGLIVPCRVQLLSLNQPCAAISGVRRAKRLQPAISFRLSAGHKTPIADLRPTATPLRGARTVSGNIAAWQAPGAMSAGRPVPRPRRPRQWSCHTAPRDPLCKCLQASAVYAYQNTCHMVMTSFVTSHLVHLLLLYHCSHCAIVCI